MSKASELHTQCLYQDLSDGAELGASCSGVGVINESVIVNVDDDDNDNFKEYEKLAESIEDTPYATSDTYQAIPYFVCEQYCSNDLTCLGFVPDYSYGQETGASLTSSFQSQQVQYDSVRCILARNESPNGAAMDSSYGLTIQAPCFTKLPGMCIAPNGATVERATAICDECSKLPASVGGNCFWCEPIVTNILQSSTAQPGKCVCQASMILPEGTTGDSDQQMTVCDLLLPHNKGSPMEYMASGPDPYDLIFPSNNSTNNTSIGATPPQPTCKSSINNFRSVHGGLADVTSNGTNSVVGVATSVMVMAVIISIAICGCICCCIFYVCCCRNKNRRPGHGGAGAGSSLPSHNNATNNNNSHQTSAMTTNNTTTYAPTQNAHQQNSHYTTTNNHYSTPTPVGAVPVPALAGGTAAAVGYSPDPYTNTSSRSSGLGGYDKPINYSYSNLEPVPVPSSNPNYNNSLNANYDDDDVVPIAVPSGGEDYVPSTGQQQQHRPIAPPAGGPTMVRVVAPCDMDEGYRFGASHQGQQFEIAAPAGGLKAGQEIIVSVPKPDQTEADVHRALPVARPVVD